MELFGEYEDNFELGWWISCAAGKWEHYRPELQSQIGVWRGDHFIKVHMTFIASIKLNQDKSVHSRHINHSNLTLIKTTIWFQPPSSLGLSRRLDKIYIWTSHTALCNCCVVFSHLELAVINAFVMTMELDTHKPVTTCTPLMGVSTLTSLMATGHLKRSSVIVWHNNFHEGFLLSYLESLACSYTQYSVHPWQTLFKPRQS